jgi:hypothetical protein
VAVIAVIGIALSVAVIVGFFVDAVIARFSARDEIRAIRRAAQWRRRRARRFAARRRAAQRRHWRKRVGELS